MLVPLPITNILSVKTKDDPVPATSVAYNPPTNSQKELAVFSSQKTVELIPFAQLLYPPITADVLPKAVLLAPHITELSGAEAVL